MVEIIPSNLDPEQIRTETHAFENYVVVLQNNDTLNTIDARIISLQNYNMITIAVALNVNFVTILDNILVFSSSKRLQIYDLDEFSPNYSIDGSDLCSEVKIPEYVNDPSIEIRGFWRLKDSRCCWISFNNYLYTAKYRVVKPSRFYSRTIEFTDLQINSLEIDGPVFEVLHNSVVPNTEHYMCTDGNNLLYTFNLKGKLLDVMKIKDEALYHIWQVYPDTLLVAKLPNYGKTVRIEMIVDDKVVVKKTIKMDETQFLYSETNFLAIWNTKTKSITIENL